MNIQDINEYQNKKLEYPTKLTQEKENWLNSLRSIDGRSKKSINW